MPLQLEKAENVSAVMLRKSKIGHKGKGWRATWLQGPPPIKAFPFAGFLVASPVQFICTRAGETEAKVGQKVTLITALFIHKINHG